MKSVRLQPHAQADVATAVTWYQSQAGLGIQFILEVDAAIERAAANPLGYERVVGSARRVLTRRFPYAIYSDHGDLGRPAAGERAAPPENRHGTRRFGAGL